MSGSFSFPANTYILIGTVVKAHGLRGEVSLHLYSGQPENLQDYRALVLVDKGGTLSPELGISKSRIQGGKTVVLFDGVSDRTFAEGLVGMGVLLARADLPELKSDEYYWHKLIGLQVSTITGRKLGSVESIFSNGAQDIMVIGAGPGEYMIPMTAGIIVEQSSEAMVIDPPPGLLEINSGDDE